MKICSRKLGLIILLAMVASSAYALKPAKSAKITNYGKMDNAVYFQTENNVYTLTNAIDENEQRTDIQEF